MMLRKVLSSEKRFTHEEQKDLEALEAYLLMAQGFLKRSWVMEQLSVHEAHPAKIEIAARSIERLLEILKECK